ncbi:MAG: lysophospholipid acyltransferase family protein [Candidatus Latescibacter sp.]|nr:lysophospholipid acyltransferase family protein [Candidatus Latescibacter sp.]
MSRAGILKQLKKDVAYVFLRGIIGFFCFFPRKTALRIGAFLGMIAPYLARKEYNLVLDQLALAFGTPRNGRDTVDLAHSTFRCMAMNFVDSARLKVMTREEIRAVSIPHNLETLPVILKKGGAIFLTSHTGCWELLGSYLVAEGIPLAVIARRFYDERLEKVLLSMREQAGMRVISRGENTREIIRALRDGYGIGVLIDQDTRVKGTFVDFFGKPAWTATGPAYLSLRYGAPVVPIFTYRDQDDRHHACIGEPISITGTGDRERDVAELTARCSRAIENFIREHPEQWVWFHRRWKTLPPNDRQVK